MRERSSLLGVFFALLGSCAIGFGSIEPELAELESLVTGLGVESFSQRVAAESALLERSKAHPEATGKWLRARLRTETDPEIALRLRKLVESIALSFPREQVRFTKEGIEQGVWTHFDEKPTKAHYKLKGGILEYDSTEVVSEALVFIHRFADRGANKEKLRVGPRPDPVPQRLVLDAEIRVLKEEHVSPGLSGVHMNVEDHRSSFGLMILEDGIFTYRNKMVHRLDTTDGWHHYRFVVEGDSQKVFVDNMDTPVFNLKRPRRPGRHWATFGDGTAAAGAHAQIRKVTLLRYDLQE